MLNLPSTTVRSKYLKSLPINTVFIDPKNGHKYQVVERKLNNTLVKTANHYLKDDVEPMKLEDIPQEMLKMDNPIKANISKVMKNRITDLEERLRDLLQKQEYKKPLYQEIKEILDDNWFEAKDRYYILHSGLVFPFKKSKYPSLDDAFYNLDKAMNSLLSDRDNFKRMMEKQHSIQSELYNSIVKEDHELKEIIL